MITKDRLKILVKHLDKNLMEEILDNNDFTNFIDIYLDDNYELEDEPTKDYIIIDKHRFTDLNDIPLNEFEIICKNI